MMSAWAERIGKIIDDVNNPLAKFKIIHTPSMIALRYSARSPSYLQLYKDVPSNDDKLLFLKWSIPNDASDCIILRHTDASNVALSLSMELLTNNAIDRGIGMDCGHWIWMICDQSI